MSQEPRKSQEPRVRLRDVTLARRSQFRAGTFHDLVTFSRLRDDG